MAQVSLDVIDDNGDIGQHCRRSSADDSAKLIPSQMTSSSHSLNTDKRIAYLDWLRIVSIYLVVLVHTAGRVSSVVGFTDQWTFDVYNSALRGLLQFGMPLLFYLSGQAMAITSDGFNRFLYKKVMRLLVPTAMGMVFLVFPASFIGRKTRRGANPDIDNIPIYFVDFFRSQFRNNGFEWLWFLPVLFTLCIVNYPILAWIRARRHRKHHSISQLRGLFRWKIFWFAQSLSIIGLILMARWMSPLLTTLCIAPYVLVIIVALTIKIDRCRPLSMLVMMVGVNALPSLLLAFYRHGLGDNQLISFVFFNMFFLQGLIEKLFEDQINAFRLSPLYMKMKPLHMMMRFFFVTLCFPAVKYNVGYLYVYPLYTESAACVLFVLGTWNMISIITRWGRSFVNTTLHPFLFEHASRSSIVVYMVHSLFVEIVIVGLVVPALAPLGVVLTVPLAYMAVVALCILTYALATVVPTLGLIFGMMNSTGKRR